MPLAGPPFCGMRVAGDIAGPAGPGRCSTDGNTTPLVPNARDVPYVLADGGLDELVKAAQDEGELNVIALPPDWANYGEVISTFEDKYDIKVNSDQPDAASQDEINAANDLKGTDRAPDVFDLGQSVALANTDMFAPYQVETWDDIPDEFKDPDGTWVNDYGGYMSIGYDSSVVPDVTSVELGMPERVR